MPPWSKILEDELRVTGKGLVSFQLRLAGVENGTSRGKFNASSRHGLLKLRIGQVMTALEGWLCLEADSWNWIPGYRRTRS